MVAVCEKGCQYPAIRSKLFIGSHKPGVAFAKAFPETREQLPTYTASFISYRLFFLMLFTITYSIFQILLFTPI